MGIFEKEIKQLELKMKIIKKEMVIEILCAVVNIAIIISLTILSIVFDKWWVVLFSIFLFRCKTKSLEEMR